MADMLAAHAQRITDVAAACRDQGAQLTGVVTHNGRPVDGPTLLWALAGNESNFGALFEYVRAEKAYMPGGYYYRRSAQLRANERRWGALACSSFGTFQVMYQVACELGYTEHPILLQNDKVCAKWAAALVKRIVRQGAKTLTDVLDAYNSGTFRDANVPEQYIAKGIRFYEAGMPSTDGSAAA